MRLGRRKIGAAAAARRLHHDMRAEQVHCAVFQVPGHHPAACPILHDEIEREIFDKELGAVPEALLIERVQQRVAGAVGGRTGAFRQSLPPLHGVAAERPLIDMPVLGARERHAEMLELDDRRHRVLAHVFDRVLIAEPVGALDRVVHVPAPIVLAHIADAAPMPPWAATVWLRVGNTLLMQAVFRPAAVMPSVARNPAPPPPTTTTS